MKSAMTLALTCAFGLLAAGCSKEASPPYDTTLSTRDVMKLVIDPAATSLWNRAGTVDTVEGTRYLTPTTEDDWQAAENEAATVVEGGNLILIPDRVRKLKDGDEDWTAMTQQMIKIALEEKDAVVARDGQKMFDVGGRLYEACTACHEKYLIPFLDENGEPTNAPGTDGRSR